MKVAIETGLIGNPIKAYSARHGGGAGKGRGCVQVRGASETEHPTLVPYLDHLNKPTINDFSSWRNLTAV